MGDPTPITVAKSGMSTIEIAERMNAAQVKDGEGCKDHLIPAIEKSLKDSKGKINTRKSCLNRKQLKHGMVLSSQ